MKKIGQCYNWFFYILWVESIQSSIYDTISISQYIRCEQAVCPIDPRATNTRSTTSNLRRRKILFRIPTSSYSQHSSSHPFIHCWKSDGKEYIYSDFLNVRLRRKGRLEYAFRIYRSYCLNLCRRLLVRFSAAW